MLCDIVNFDQSRWFESYRLCNLNVSNEKTDFTN